MKAVGAFVAAVTFAGGIMFPPYAYSTPLNHLGKSSVSESVKSACRNQIITNMLDSHFDSLYDYTEARSKETYECAELFDFDMCDSFIGNLPEDFKGTFRQVEQTLVDIFKITLTGKALEASAAYCMRDRNWQWYEDNN